MSAASLCLAVGACDIMNKDGTYGASVHNVKNQAFFFFFLSFLLFAVRHWWTPYNHAPVYSVTLSKAVYIGCMCA